MFLTERHFVFLFFFLCLITRCAAQNGIMVFTDGPVDQNLLKQRINYVDHTLDPATAHVHVFITRQRLGSRGRKYMYELTGKQELEGNSLTFEFTADNTLTAIEIDQAIIDRLELGLAGFLAGTDYAPSVKVAVDASLTSEVARPGETSEVVVSGFDWDSWIFELFSNFRFENTSFRSTSDFRAGLRIDRSTPELRVRINPLYSNWVRTVTTTDEDGNPKEVRSFRKRMSIWGSVVKSISDHWSLGLFASAEHHSFNNIDLGTWVAPAIEYNFFSYDEVPFKEFTAAYRIGWVHNEYLEETVFFQTEENLARHLLDVDLRLRQKWGNLFTGISAGAYLNDHSMNRFSFDARCDVRILKGLSVNVGGSYEIINDQINLPRGDASLEEILLGQTQLATNFDADIRFGLSYTFGSLYNNVVNTRL